MHNNHGYPDRVFFTLRPNLFALIAIEIMAKEIGQWKRNREENETLQNSAHALVSHSPSPRRRSGIKIFGLDATRLLKSN